jgi:predicted AAA+ superfamily ATPase
MNDPEMQRLMSRNCRWWRQPQGWEADDPDLRRLRNSPLDYEPAVLADVVPDGLYVLRGPRRVGKSVEVKRTIASLLHLGVEPRQIIHYACDTLTRGELQQVERVGRNLATAGLQGPRYWFLDEITAVEDWPKEIKWLRDNTELGQDCVVLTGSSSRDLDQATNELADRRGGAERSDRLLLPMSFRTFCQQFRPGQLPLVPVIRARDFLDGDCEEALSEMTPWIDELVSLWEVYCGCGGLPPAVAGQIDAGAVAESFIQALFDVVHGDALRRGSLTPTQSLLLLAELSKALGGFMNMSDLARSIGVGDHKTAERRIGELIDNYLVWPCHQRGQHSFPNLAAQSKYYFTDPLLARLAHLRNERLPEPDLSVISEQQIGQHLVRQAAAGDPGAYNEFTSVMCMRTPSRQEVDFVGPAVTPLGFEGKYSDTGVERETLTLAAACGQGVMATRALLGRSEKNERIRFIPAAFVAYLLAE